MLSSKPSFINFHLLHPFHQPLLSLYSVHCHIACPASSWDTVLSNTLMFQFFPTTVYSKSKTFQFPLLSRYTRSWEWAWSAELTWTTQSYEPYSGTPCSVYELGGAGQEELITVQEQSGHWSACDEQLYCASRVFVSFYSSLSLFHYCHYNYCFILFQLTNCSYLNPQVWGFLYSLPLCGVGKEGATVRCLIAVWG